MGLDRRGGMKPESISPRVLIVGCGNIAGMFDRGRKPGEFPYTHAGGYARDGRFNMLACVEPDETRRRCFMADWGIPNGFATMEEIGDLQRFDVISICSPTLSHAHDLEMALRLEPKLIFCEKPVTASLSETERLVARCQEAGVPVAVNYTRRWDPEFLKLKSDIQAGKWGPLRSVMGVYNKGILNNGSHMVDLLHFLLGTLEIRQVGKPVHDYFPDDPTIPVWLESVDQGIPIHLGCGYAADYAIAEFQFIFSGGMLVMEEGGLFWRVRHVVDSGTFKGYRVLSEGERYEGGISQAMLGAVDNLFRALDQGEPLASTGESALSAQRLCERIKQIALAL